MAKFNFNQMYKGFDEGKHKKRLLQHFHAVPAPIRDLLISQNKSGKFQGVFREAISSSGRCSYSTNGPSKIWLTSTSDSSIEFSYIHEIGHGVTYVLEKKAGLRTNELLSKMEGFMAEAKAYNASRGSNDPKIRSYSLTAPPEFWADTFNDYYCSPATHEFLKTKLPKNYAFVSKFLDKPLFLGEDSGTGGGDTGFPDGPMKNYTSSLQKLFNEITESCEITATAADVNNAASSAVVKFDVKVKGKESPLKLSATVKGDQFLSTQLSSLRFQVANLDKLCE